MAINRHYQGTAFNQELLKMYKMRRQTKDKSNHRGNADKKPKIQCFDDLNPPTFDVLHGSHAENEDIGRQWASV